MFSKILLASDGSDHALRAAEKAAAIARLDTGSIVTVVYVIDGDTSKSDVLSAGSKEALKKKEERNFNRSKRSS